MVESPETASQKQGMPPERLCEVPQGRLGDWAEVSPGQDDPEQNWARPVKPVWFRVIGPVQW